MKSINTFRQINYIKLLTTIIFGFGLFLFPAYYCWGQYSNQPKIDRCKTIVAVGVIKTKGIDSDRAARIISDELNKGTKISAVPILKISNERNFREQALQVKPDFFLQIETVEQVEAVTGRNPLDGGGYLTTKPLVLIIYKLFKVGSSSPLNSAKIKKANRTFEGAWQEVFTEFETNTSSFFTTAANESITMERLTQRHLCFSRFPEKLSSLIMKFNVRAKIKEIAYDYYIKGEMWRLDVRPLNGSAFITGFNGKEIWTLNKEEGLNAVIVGGESGGRRNLNFLLGEFLSESSSENLKFEVQKVELIGKETVNGKSCHVLEARTRGATYIKSFYDAETGALLKKILLDGKDIIQQETNYENYEDIGNGVMFPMSIKTKSADGDAEIAFSKNGIVLNPSIPDIMFLRPSGGK